MALGWLTQRPAGEPQPVYGFGVTPHAVGRPGTVGVRVLLDPSAGTGGS